MMPRGFTVQNFAADSKSDWLFADLNTAIHLTTLFMIAWMAASATAVHFWPGAYSAYDTMRETYGFQDSTAIVVLACGAGLIALSMVFIGRWNPEVMGPKRTFRYICRWL